MNRRRSRIMHLFNRIFAPQEPPILHQGNEGNEGKIGEGRKMEAEKCIRRQGNAYLTGTPTSDVGAGGRPPALPMNPDPHLTLTLSPPIRSADGLPADSG